VNDDHRAGCIDLHVVRHPAIPVPRGEESFDQADDPAFRAANDDVDPRISPEQIARAAAALTLAPGLPVSIWHSPAYRTYRAAGLFLEALAPRARPVLVSQIPELSEPLFRLGELVTRAQFEDPNRPRRLVFDAFSHAVLTDDRAAIDGGRACITRRVLRLRELLAESPPGTLIWLTHGLLMPFLHLTLVDGVEPADWRTAHLERLRLFDYATGFSLCLPVCPQPTAKAS
jgi:hypothetical protein